MVRTGSDCIFAEEPGEGALVRVEPLIDQDWAVKAACSSDKLWAVANSLSYRRFKGHLLVEGDFIRLGRDCFRVLQVSIDGSSAPKLPEIGACLDEPETPLK